MANLNRCEIIGRLTRDPEHNVGPSGIPVTSFGVATNSYGRGDDGEKREYTDFHNVVCWDQGKRELATLTAQFLRKGALVFIEGRMRTRSWEQDGVRRYRTEIHAVDVQFLEKKRDPELVPAGSTYPLATDEQGTLAHVDPDDVDIPF
jgi:single-strand DNA-binding protein